MEDSPSDIAHPRPAPPAHLLCRPGARPRRARTRAPARTPFGDPWCVPNPDLLPAVPIDLDNPRPFRTQQSSLEGCGRPRRERDGQDVPRLSCRSPWSRPVRRISRMLVGLPVLSVIGAAPVLPHSLAWKALQCRSELCARVCGGAASRPHRSARRVGSWYRELARHLRPSSLRVPHAPLCFSSRSAL